MSYTLTISKDGSSIHARAWSPGQLAISDFSKNDQNHARNDGTASVITDHPVEFPKYTTQLLNPANQFSQATRTDVVGDMNELTREFNHKHPEGDFADWVDFYTQKHNGRQRIGRAVEKMFPMVVKMRNAFKQIDREMCRDYIRDLVLYKTYRGFDVERMILQRLADRFSVNWKKSTSDDESQGIDGYLGDLPVQIKPRSYKTSGKGGCKQPCIFYERDENEGVFIVEFSQISGEI